MKRKRGKKMGTRGSKKEIGRCVFFRSRNIAATWQLRISCNSLRPANKNTTRETVSHRDRLLAVIMNDARNPRVILSDSFWRVCDTPVASGPSYPLVRYCNIVIVECRYWSRRNFGSIENRPSLRSESVHNFSSDRTTWINECLINT